MPTFIDTLVQKTSVHINNIIAVTGQILTNFFEPNFLGFIICVDKIVLRPKLFRPTFISAKKKISDHKIFSNPKIFDTQFLFFKTKIFGGKFE